MRIGIVIGLMVLVGCQAEEPICLAEAQANADSAKELLEEMESRMSDACEAAYGSYWFYSRSECVHVERQPAPEVESCGG